MSKGDEVIEELAEIGQISVYLGRINSKIHDCVDVAKLKTQKGHSPHIFEVGEIRCQFTYFITETRRENPPWLDFVNEMIPAENRPNFSTVSQNANGIIILEMYDRLLIATFGRAASGMLLRYALESDFGIKSAMNMCGNEQVRQTQSQSMSVVPTHIARQASRPSESFTFGLSDSEDLKYISAHMKTDKSITLQGRNYLTIKTSAKKKLTWDSLILTCKEFIEAYNRTDYLTEFPNFRNFKAVEKDMSEKLDAILIESLKKREFGNIQLWIPEFLPEDEYAFSYLTETRGKTKPRTHDFLLVSQLDSELDLNRVTPQVLKDRRITAYSYAEDRMLWHKYWPIYGCLIAEFTVDGAFYVLSDSEWRIVDPNFQKEIVKFIKSVKVELPERNSLNIDIFDEKRRQNREEIFNKSFCAAQDTAIKFDQAKLRIGNSRKDKEFCDILDFCDDLKVRIIHCKPLSGSSAVSYLFTQARFYCESFIRDQTLLNDVREYITKSGSAYIDLYLNEIPARVEEINGSNYRVCIWLLYNKKEIPNPSLSGLPLTAQFELKVMHEHLRKFLKFKEVIVRFVPVVRNPVLKETIISGA